MAVVALLPATVGAAESATAVSPITQHHRAFREALAKGDLALAEAEAAKALDASIAAKGDAPPTAALAVNLANVRLARHQPAAAVEPARRALAIAEKHGDSSGVDIHSVRLLVGRAELPGGGEAAMGRLLQAVRDAQGVPGIQVDAYAAAVELAVAAHDAKRYEVAREAWIASGRFARGSRVSPEHALGRAKLGEAVARTAPLAQTAFVSSQEMAEFVAIDTLLAEAMDAVSDQATQTAIGGEVTPAQAVYGEAAALKAAIPARLAPDERSRWQPREPQKTNAQIGEALSTTPICDRKWNSEPKPDLPNSQRVVGGVGSVVLKALTDQSGAVTRVQVVGAAGGPEFENSVVAAVKQWHVEKTDTATAGCTLAGERFLAVTFIYGE